MIVHRFLGLCSVFKQSFSFHCSGWIIPSSLLSSLLFFPVISSLLPSPYTVCFFFFNFSYCIFQFLKLPLGSSLYLLGSLLRPPVFHLCWEFVWLLACWSLSGIAALSSSSHNSNICVILALVSVDYLFPWELRFSWFFARQVILDYILDILMMMYDTLGFVSILRRMLIFLV